MRRLIKKIPQDVLRKEEWIKMEEEKREEKTSSSALIYCSYCTSPTLPSSLCSPDPIICASLPTHNIYFTFNIHFYNCLTTHFPVSFLLT